MSTERINVNLSVEPKAINQVVTPIGPHCKEHAQFSAFDRAEAAKNIIFAKLCEFIEQVKIADQTFEIKRGDGATFSFEISEIRDCLSQMEQELVVVGDKESHFCYLEWKVLIPVVAHDNDYGNRQFNVRKLDLIEAAINHCFGIPVCEGSFRPTMEPINNHVPGAVYIYDIGIEQILSQQPSVKPKDEVSLKGTSEEKKPSYAYFEVDVPGKGTVKLPLELLKKPKNESFIPVCINGGILMVPVRGPGPYTGVNIAGIGKFMISTQIIMDAASSEIKLADYGIKIEEELEEENTQEKQKASNEIKDGQRSDCKKEETTLKTPPLNSQLIENEKPVEVTSSQNSKVSTSSVHTKNIKTQISRDRTAIVDVQKANLIQQLTDYINRIQSHKNNQGKNDYTYGFWFFTDSRALNRRANYKLAKQFHKELNNGSSISSVFLNFPAKRAKLKDKASGKKLNESPDYVERGINSKALNTIIKTALKINDI